MSDLAVYGGTGATDLDVVSIEEPLMSRCWAQIRRWLLALLVAAGSTGVGAAQLPSARPTARPDVPAVSPVRAFVSQYCLACHNGEKKKGKLNLEAISSERVDLHSKVWTKVVRKLRARKMPPDEAEPRPDERIGRAYAIGGIKMKCYACAKGGHIPYCPVV